MKISTYFKVITAAFAVMTLAMGLLVVTGAPVYNVSTEETVAVISAIMSVVASSCVDRFEEKEDC